MLDLESELKVDTLKGPTWLPATIHHKNRIAITGVIKQVSNTSFTILSEGEEHSLNFNENISYRVNSQGRIIEKQGFYLEEGKEYKIIYAHPEDPLVKIIILMN